MSQGNTSPYPPASSPPQARVLVPPTLNLTPPILTLTPPPERDAPRRNSNQSKQSNRHSFSPTQLEAGSAKPLFPPSHFSPPLVAGTDLPMTTFKLPVKAHKRKKNSQPMQPDLAPNKTSASATSSKYSFLLLSTSLLTHQAPAKLVVISFTPHSVRTLRTYSFIRLVDPLDQGCSTHFARGPDWQI